MRYLLLIYGDETEMKTWPEDELGRCVGEALQYDEVLKQNGQFIVAHGLEWPSQATVLRKKSGKLVSTDGPFAETKEQLLGFYLVDCENLDEVIDFAKRMKEGESCTFEIRPIRIFEKGVLPEEVKVAT